MAPRRRTTATRKTAAKRQAVGRFTRKRPLLITAVAMALGAVVGSFIRFTPEEKRLLGEHVGKLKEQAASLKNSVSDLAIDGYVRAKQAARHTIDSEFDALGEKPAPCTIGHNSLVMGINGS
jgi:hypothetical protein